MKHMERRLIPVTVFTGYLGSGKTTIILNLVSKLPQGYTAVLLKNEYGDTAVDSELAKESNIGVKEYLNGCLCCVLIGKLGLALQELLRDYHPDRIFIETSGSAYPGPIAWEIRKTPSVYLDGMVTVIDALNFTGYKDKSYTAKLQTKDTDLILINKHESINEEKLDRVLDDVYELNPSTPKIKTDRGKIDPDVIFGLDSKLFEKFQDVQFQEQRKDAHHHEHELGFFSYRSDGNFFKPNFEQFLDSIPKEDFYRIKGIILFENSFYVLNYVFGKFSFTPIQKYKGPTKLLFIGPSVASYKSTIEKRLSSMQKRTPAK